MPTWPASLPQEPLIKEYQEAPKSNVIRSEMSSGPTKTRRRSTARMTNTQVIYLLSQVQRETFEQWFENDIADGAIAFNWPRPRVGMVPALITGDPPYTLATAGKGYRLSMTLQVQPH